MNAITGRFSRRAVLVGIASVPAIGAATEAPAAFDQHDPLAETIAEYYAKMAEFMAYPMEQVASDEEEEAVVAATYGPSSDRLTYDTPPATSLRGVAEAIRYTLDQRALVDRTCENTLKSALIYLDSVQS